MEHVVFFPAHDGTPAFRRFASLDEAARFVEHLRNVDGVSEASVHALTEVPLAFKAFYRVELPQTEQAPVELPEAEQAPVELPQAELPHGDPSPAEQAAPEGAVADSMPVSTAAADIVQHADAAEPTTIAEAIEGLRHDEAAPAASVQAATGSATGILVRDHDFAPLGQLSFAAPLEVGAVAAASPQAVTDQPTFDTAAAQSEGPDAKVLEPVFGARRERGLGYFAR